MHMHKQLAFSQKKCFGERFLKRNYPLEIIKNVALLARGRDRQNLLTQTATDTSSSNKNKVLLFTSYHPDEQCVLENARHNYPLLEYNYKKHWLFNRKLIMAAKIIKPWDTCCVYTYTWSHKGSSADHHNSSSEASKKAHTNAWVLMKTWHFSWQSHKHKIPARDNHKDLRSSRKTCAGSTRRDFLWHNKYAKTFFK